MANTALPQESFKSLLIKQMFIAIAVSMAFTIPLVLTPAYFIFNQMINSDLKDIEQTTHESISTHLRTGWQPANIDKVYQDMRERLPDAAMFLQKAPTYLDAYDDVVDPATPTTATFETLIAQVEKTNDELLKPILAAPRSMPQCLLNLKTNV